jgi:hypothetical protein
VRLLLAAGHHGRQGDLNTAGVWEKLTGGLSKAQLSQATRTTLGLIEQQPLPRPRYWRGAASTAFHHLLRAAEVKRHLEPALQIFEARTRHHARKRDFPPHVKEVPVLDALLGGGPTPALMKRAFTAISTRMKARFHLLEVMPLLRHFHARGRQLRAARLLAAHVNGRESMVTGKAAPILARLPDPGAQRIAARALLRALRGGDPVVQQKLCKAVAELTHGPSQATLLDAVLAVAKDARHSHYTRGPALLALGSMLESRAQRRAVKVLRTLTRDPKPGIRSNALHALGLLRDPAVQATAIDDVLAGLGDSYGLARVEALKSLGQFAAPAAVKKARRCLSDLRACMPGKASVSIQLREIAACGLKQLDGRRPREARCPY